MCYTITTDYNDEVKTMNRQFPCLEVHLDRLYHNAEQVISRCKARGIHVCGVIKGVGGMPEVARAISEAGAEQIGTSRLEQVARCRAAGVTGPFLLIRIPGLSELADTVALCEMSLQSEVSTLDALERECQRQGKTHSVIVMADLGDLREGFWDKDELVSTCEMVERDLPHVQLAGVGVNLGCYGSIQPTPENLGQLAAIARRVEAAIGRKLEIVSGGATSSFTLVHWGTMPEGINHLRIGEGILVAKDLQVDWGIHDMDYLRMDCMTLRAQIVEVKDKPTHPVGPIMVDCFCNRPTYEDRGIRRRAIAGIGRADVGDIMMLHPRTPGMMVVGGSSDHCILDVEDCDPCPQVGDIVDFDVIYLTMLYASAREDVAVKFVD